VLGAVLITAVLSVLLYTVVGLAERVLVPWHRAARNPTPR
jgi:ABC-type nitrate/sulfonate/bicarbonate transport system permease component